MCSIVLKVIIYQFANWSESACWDKGGRCYWEQGERKIFFHHPTQHFDQKQNAAERNGEKGQNVDALPIFWLLSCNCLCVCKKRECLYTIPAFVEVSVWILIVWHSVSLSGHWAAKWHEPESKWNLEACMSVLTTGLPLPTDNTATLWLL